MLGYLETVDIRDEFNEKPLRFPVQWVNRPSAEFEVFGFGSFAAKVTKRFTFWSESLGRANSVEELESAVKPQSVTLTLDKEIDVSRGDVIVSSNQPCESLISLTVNWFG